MRVLGISGKAQHGKDTLAGIAQEVMKEEFGVLMGKWSLAHTLKAAVYGESSGAISFEDIWYNKPKDVRSLLQYRGTEDGRLKFGEDVWALQTEAYLRLFSESMPFMGAVVIPDVRFMNEVRFVSLGGRVDSRVRLEVSNLARDFIGYSEEVELDLLYNEPEKLLKYDLYWSTVFDAYYQKEIASSPGMCVRIKSDRPTLMGPEVAHASETALDNVPEEEFDAMIINNQDTTLEDLRVQIRPVLKRLLEI